MKKNLFLLILSISLFSFYSSFAQWQDLNGPYGAPINSIVLSGSNIFVSASTGTTGKGVFLSTDEGASWKGVNTGLNTLAVNTLALNGADIFAGTYAGGAFITSDNGKHWSSLPNGMTFPVVWAFAFSGSNIFAGNDGGWITNGARLYKSTNNGVDWYESQTGLPGDVSVRTFAVSGSNIFAGTRSKGMFLSTNNGTSWFEFNNGLTDLNIRTSVIKGSNIFVGTYGGGIFYSPISGANWTSVNSGLRDLYIGSLAVSGNNIFAGSFENGVFFSTDNGSNWKVANTGLTDSITYSLTANATNVYLGTTGSAGGVWKRSIANILSGVNDLENQNNDLLVQIYPNPCFQTANIKYYTSNKGFNSVKVFDLSGREVASLTNGIKEKGTHSILYNAQNLNNGVYYIKIAADNTVRVVKFLKQ